MGAGECARLRCAHFVDAALSNASEGFIQRLGQKPKLLEKPLFELQRLLVDEVMRVASPAAVKSAQEWFEVRLRPVMENLMPVGTDEEIRIQAIKYVATTAESV